MPTLLLRLCGPMQSWGTRSRWSERDTELEPSLSGVIGLLCAAKGVQREQPIPAEWLGLRMGVRIDHEGTMARDYHTAGGAYPKGHGVARADGGNLDNAVLSNRYYLADADFLVGLEHPEEQVLREIEAAIRAPHWQLFLGRKSFAPAVPLHHPPRCEPGTGLRQGELTACLAAEPPWLPVVGRHRASAADRRVRFVTQSPTPTSEIRMDQPRADSFSSRKFEIRYVTTTFGELPGRNTDA